MHKVFSMCEKDPNKDRDEYNPVSTALASLTDEEIGRFREEFSVYDNYMMTHEKSADNERLALEEVDRVFGYG